MFWRMSTLKRAVLVIFSFWAFTTLYILSKTKSPWTKQLPKIHIRRIREDFVDPRAVPIKSSLQEYGEMGEAVTFPENISDVVQKQIEEGYNRHGFNQYVSDLISVHRKLPDCRDPWCINKAEYLAELPTTSVIICFYDEAWTVLLRTVHSVLERSPPHLLKEVILVDDYSKMPYLKQQLADYMSIYPKVKIVRATKREGLIRGRLLGAEHATSPVLTFLDAHCECTPGWLEPLLDRIGRNETTVVCPVIDAIDAETLEYHTQKNKPDGGSMGGFTWNLQFNWIPIPEREKKRRAHSALPLYSPTMAGGLFAISKNFFNKLGTYDKGYDFWGSENLELSFKTWMCGGTLEIVPCSHVGHIFRTHHLNPPRKWPGGDDVVKKNSVRLAKVWLDEYAKYYYRKIGNDLGNYGDVSSRIELRKSLGCKSFKWFIDNVYPEVFDPSKCIAYGEIRNHGYGGNICLDARSDGEAKNMPVGLFQCHKMGGNQYWMLSNHGEMRREELCLDYSNDGILMYSCHGQKGNQQWVYEPETHFIRHVPTTKCLTIASTVINKTIRMDNCDENHISHKWKLENYNDTKNLLYKASY